MMSEGAFMSLDEMISMPFDDLWAAANPSAIPIGLPMTPALDFSPFPSSSSYQLQQTNPHHFELWVGTAPRYNASRGAVPFGYELWSMLDGDNLKRGVQSGVLMRLPVRSAAANDAGKQCQICLDNYVVGTEVTALPCGHEFCNGCVTHWLKGHHSCPVCRWEFPEQQTHLVSST